jgi:phosphatidylglycerol:prolipoprotein diacylglycerol transferase
VGLAIVVQFQLVLRRAPRAGIERGTASALVGWAIAAGLVGAHVFDVLAYYPERLRQDPLELLRVWGGLSSLGGMLAGLTGLYVAMRWHGLSRAAMARFADCVLFALPFTLAVGRAGCALQHDHLGIATGHWLAVRFPDGPRLDLGLLEFLALLPVCALFAWLGRRSRPPGFFAGLFFALYGPLRFCLDVFRVGDARYFGWTPGQYLSLLAALLGLGVLAALAGRSRGRAAAARLSGSAPGR